MIAAIQNLGKLLPPGTVLKYCEDAQQAKTTT